MLIIRNFVGKIRVNMSAYNKYKSGKSNQPDPDKKNKPYKKRGSTSNKGEPLPKFSDEVRLNKYLANAGIASRREADKLIASGVVSVNGKVITEMGFKVKPGDEVKYDGIGIKQEKKFYVLLNKPKGFSVNMTSNMERSIFGLLRKATKEPVFPVDKLHRDFLGLLLCTNDNDLIKKLNHPKTKYMQVFHIELDKGVTPEDLKQLKSGVFIKGSRITLEDVQIQGSSNREIGLSIKSNKNRIIEKLFDEIGFKVVKLDRTEFAGLSKKDVPRGHYRHLTEKEVAFLKMV